MARYELVLPPEPVAVVAFTELVESVTDRLISGIYEPRTLADLRDTVLPRLMSGEIRLSSEAEKGAEADL